MFSKRIILLFSLLCFFLSSNAQYVEEKKSPTKASIYSTVLPGAGQFYNKKYWKVPVLYAAMGTALYVANWNRKEYLSYRKAYEYRTDTDESTVDEFEGIYTENNLVTIKNYHRKNRDLGYIIMVGIYLLNIVDASVDAHLFNFNVNDNLSLRVAPNMMRLQNENQYGLTLTLNL
tara:strand:- start:986 stop:1510 length:525 start_codon:yes stop_codon:yes gene_type:complete